MDEMQLLSFMGRLGRLRGTLRHNWFADGRRESVAEHCWLAALMERNWPIIHILA